MNQEKIIQISEKVPPCFGRVTNDEGRYYTVDFQLDNTLALVDLLDNYREKGDFLMDELPAKGKYLPNDPAQDRFLERPPYDCRLEINSYPEDRIEVSLRYCTTDPFETDCRVMHEITLEGSQENRILEMLNSQCQQLFGKSCEDLLAEAKKRMR